MLFVLGLPFVPRGGAIDARGGGAGGVGSGRRRTALVAALLGREGGRRTGGREGAGAS